MNTHRTLNDFSNESEEKTKDCAPSNKFSQLPSEPKFVARPGPWGLRGMPAEAFEEEMDAEQAAEAYEEGPSDVASAESSCLRPSAAAS